METNDEIYFIALAMITVLVSLAIYGCSLWRIYSGKTIPRLSKFDMAACVFVNLIFGGLLTLSSCWYFMFANLVAVAVVAVVFYKYDAVEIYFAEVLDQRFPNEYENIVKNAEARSDIIEPKVSSVYVPLKGNRRLTLKVLIYKSVRKRRPFQMAQKGVLVLYDELLKTSLEGQIPKETFRGYVVAEI